MLYLLQFILTNKQQTNPTMAQQQQTHEEIMTTYGKLQPTGYETLIHHALGERMDALIIDWTRDNYNFLVDMLDGYQGENDPNHIHYLPEDERVKPYELSHNLAEYLSNGAYESGLYKPGTSLHTHILTSNIANEYLGRIDIYVCNFLRIHLLEEVNVDIANEAQVIEVFLFCYLLDRYVLLNEFIEMRDSQLILK